MLANFRLNIRPSTSKSDILFFLANKALAANILHQGVLTITRGIGKFRLENQMVCAIPSGKLHKIWAVV